VEIALAEAKAKYKLFEINPRDKPEWCVLCFFSVSAYLYDKLTAVIGSRRR
jgi:hypothetical protein